MKKTIAIMLLVCVSSVFAGYTYEIGPGDDFGDLSLDGQESLLMTAGMGHFLNLDYWSSARIEGTDPLIREGDGGVWRISQRGNSTLEILGGDIRELDFNSSDDRGTGVGTGRAIISGGNIDVIRNYQIVDPSKNIVFICRDWLYDIDTKKLTGTWEDFSTFDIQLVDVAGREATIDNIQFIPEPATLLLFGVGGLILRKRRC